MKFITKLIGKVLIKAPAIVSLLFFSVAFFTNICRRAPIFEFFIRELELPVVYNLRGTIEIRDEEQKLLDISNISIMIGGYQEYVENGEEYNLNFSATVDEDIPVVVTYTIGDEIIKNITYITYEEEEMNKNFLIVSQGVE